MLERSPRTNFSATLAARRGAARCDLDPDSAPREFFGRARLVLVRRGAERRGEERRGHGLVYVKRSPRCNEDEDENGNEGEGEGEGETRLIKRRPPPSANGPAAQELHAGNCCANTTTFILQPLGKRIYYSTKNTAPFSFSPFNLAPATLSLSPSFCSPFRLCALVDVDEDGRVENLDATRRLGPRVSGLLTRSRDVGNLLDADRSRITAPDTITESTSRPTYVFYEGIPELETAAVAWPVMDARARDEISN